MAYKFQNLCVDGPPTCVGGPRLPRIPPTHSLWGPPMCVGGLQFPEPCVGGPHAGKRGRHPERVLHPSVCHCMFAVLTARYLMVLHPSICLSQLHCMFGVPDRNVRDSRAISQLTMSTETVLRSQRVASPCLAETVHDFTINDVDRDSAYIAGVRDMQIAMSSRDNSAISQLRTPTEIVRDIIYYNALSIRLSATVLTVRCVMAFAYYGVYTRAISLPIRLSVCLSQSTSLSVAMWQLTMCCQLSIDLSGTVTCMSVDLTYMNIEELIGCHNTHHYSFAHLPSVCLHHYHCHAAINNVLALKTARRDRLRTQWLAETTC